MKHQLENTENDKPSNLNVALQILGLVLFALGIVYILKEVSLFFKTFPNNTKEQFGYFMFYTGAMFYILFTPYVYRTWRRLKEKTLQDLELENDALVAYLKETNIDYKPEINNLIKSWKLEKDKNKKSTTMKKIKKILDRDEFYDTESKTREDAIKHNLLVGCFINFTLNHTKFISKDPITNQEELKVLQSQNVLIDKLEKLYGISSSVLEKRFSDAKTAFKNHTENKLPKRR